MTFKELLKRCATGEMPLVTWSKMPSNVGRVATIKSGTTIGQHSGCSVAFDNLSYDVWFHAEAGSDKRSKYMRDLSFYSEPKETNQDERLSIHTKLFIKENPRYSIIVWENIPNELVWDNSYGVPGSSWNEPAMFKSTDREVKDFSFLPWFNDGHSAEVLIGFYFDGNKWREIPGYRPPSFAPGYSWRDEYIPHTFRQMLESVTPKRKPYNRKFTIV